MAPKARSSRAAPQNLRRVFIRDLTLEARIGIYPKERKRPQRVIVSIDMMVKEDRRPHGDEIAGVVSYEEAVHVAEAIASSGHINLVETLAERVAEACLKDRRVVSVRVRVEKPDIFRQAAGVGVEIERKRPGAARPERR